MFGLTKYHRWAKVSGHPLLNKMRAENKEACELHDQIIEKQNTLSYDYMWTGGCSKELAERRASYKEPTAAALMRMTQEERDTYKECIELAEGISKIYPLSAETIMLYSQAYQS